jgi:hypothetical protein
MALARIDVRADKTVPFVKHPGVQPVQPANLFFKRISRALLLQVCHTEGA